MNIDFVVQLIILMLDTAVFYLYMLLLCRRYPHRNGFWLRLAAALLVQGVSCVPLALLRANTDALPMRVLFEILISAIQFAVMPALYRGSVSQYLLWYSGVLMTKNFSGNAFQLLLNLCGVDDTRTISFFHAENVMLVDWLIYAVINGLLLLLITKLFERGEKERDITPNGFVVLELTVVTLTLRCTVQPFIRIIQPETGAVLVTIRALMLIIYLMLIAIRGGLLSRKKAETELEINEGLLRAERKRYFEMRDTIELINMRFHDLRRHLNRLQGKLTEEELLTISDAIKLYDGAVRTGSEIVDAVLCQKKLICDSKGIALSYICDGSAVRFMEPSKLYSLLDNALENAIEATQELDEEERIISFSIAEAAGETRIEVSNYFDPSVAVELDTSKKDKQRHGYGLKSMRYIAESCGGSVLAETHGNMFFLTIVLPNK